MTERTFILPVGKQSLLEYLGTLDPSKKWRVTVKPYRKQRSSEQNAVSHGWYAQISRELRENTPEEVKRFCKLEFGIPLLRGDPDFNDFYGLALGPLTYEQRIEAMKYLDVTSLMTTAQMHDYMTAVQNAYAGRVTLLYPNEPPEPYE